MLLFVFFTLMGITESLPRTVYVNNQRPSHLYINAARGNTEVISPGSNGGSDIIQLVLFPTDQASNKPQIGLVHLLGETSGTLKLVQNDPPIGHTSITGTIMGLTPGKHGFHVHMTANLTQGCSSTGGHYNPFSRDHGSPGSASRHVGDLGNIEADARGIAFVDIKDTLVTLVGPNSVIGRSIVIHAGEDDLGLGGDEGSRKTGNAGGRVGCGVIGRA